MYFKVNCDHCSKTLKVREDQAGNRCRCPHCKGTFVIPEPDGEEGTESKRPAPAETKPDAVKIQLKAAESREATVRTGKSGAATSSHRTSHAKATSDASSDISLITSGVIGLIAAIAVFGALYPLSQQGLRVGSIFWDSVEINFPTTLLMCWSFAILYLKWRHLNKQKSAMLLDLLPQEISPEITLSSLDRFVEHIHSLPPESHGSILVNRVIRAIEHFRVRKSAADTVTMMESQSTIDASNIAGSYTIIKVFIWAMPILGFIGTVMGVGSAVSGLSATLENAADVSAVTDSMKSVFGGLGSAFDTTLLALIMSMMVKIPTSAMQKSEEGLVTIADEYCNEILLRRLNDGRDGGVERGGGGGGPINAKVFREAVEAAMATHHGELENWLHKLDGIGTKLTHQVAKGWAEINAKMAEQQEQQLTLFQNRYAEHAIKIQAQLAEMNSTALALGETLSELAEQTSRLQNGVVEVVDGSTKQLNDHFTGLQSGLQGLSSVLAELGTHQVLIQQVEPPRRRWFSSKPRSNGKT